jgi:hypothetical protein
MTKFKSGDSTVPTVECHVLSVLLVYFGRHGITPMTIQARCFGVCGRYLCKYYQSWDTVTRNADCLNNWSCESCLMNLWLAQSSLQQEAHLAYATTSHQHSSCCELGDCPSMGGALAHYEGVPEMGDVPKGTEYIWTYPCSILFQRLENNHHSDSSCRLNSSSERCFTEHVQIVIIWFWSSPVHASDADRSPLLCAGYTLSLFNVVCWLKWKP